MQINLYDPVTRDFFESVEINLILTADLGDSKNFDSITRFNFMYGQGKWFYTCCKSTNKVRYYSVDSKP